MQRPEAVDVLRRPNAGRPRSRASRSRAAPKHAAPIPIPATRGSRPSGAPRAPPVRDRLEPDDDRRAEHRDREQQVRDDERRVQVRVDGDRAERRLRERADEGGDGEPPRPATAAPRVNHAPTASASVRTIVTPPTSAVPELDVGVVVLLRERLPGLAAGPVLAAEPRAGQPDDRAGRDDQPERERRVTNGEPPERRRRELERTQAREPRGVDVHALRV